VPWRGVSLLSLGTGFNPASFPPPRLDLPFPFGIAGWLWPFGSATTPSFPLVSAVFDGAAEIDAFQARQILGAGFRRANPDLGAASVSLDDCGAIGQLEEVARSYVAGAAWEEIRAWLAGRLAAG
jgi:hypothetical protein